MFFLEISVALSLYHPLAMNATIMNTPTSPCLAIPPTQPSRSPLIQAKLHPRFITLPPLPQRPLQSSKTSFTVPPSIGLSTKRLPPFPLQRPLPPFSPLPSPIPSPIPTPVPSPPPVLPQIPILLSPPPVLPQIFLSPIPQPILGTSYQPAIRHHIHRSIARPAV